jgi:hypothetical protein
VKAVSRRGFLEVLAGGIALAATSGVAFIPAEVPAGLVKRVRARHLWLEGSGVFPPTGWKFAHRIDVIIGNQQVGVDIGSDSKQLTERELGPALTLLAAELSHYQPGDYEFDIRSYAADEAFSGEPARWFGRIGGA